MTLHTYHRKYSDHKCPKCKARYVPYKPGIKCPKCGYDEDITKNTDYIETLIDGLNLNMKKGNSYLPGAWYTGC